MTTNQLTLLFLVLHIISAGIWISQFVAEMALERFAASLKGKAGELAAVMAESPVAALMGTIGGTGILITGLLLTFQFHYGILGIGGTYTPTWLSIKQVIFIIAMGLVGSMITPNTRKAMPLIGQALASGQPMPAEAEALLNRVKMVSRVVNLLVLVNIFLAVYGVNGGFLS